MAVSQWLAGRVVAAPSAMAADAGWSWVVYVSLIIFAAAFSASLLPLLPPGQVYAQDHSVWGRPVHRSQPKVRERVKTDGSCHETIFPQRKGIRLADPTNESILTI